MNSLNSAERQNILLRKNQNSLNMKKTNLHSDMLLLDKLCCPVSHQALHRQENELVSSDGKYRYSISPSGIPLFAQSLITSDAEKQRVHYDKVAEKYVENLEYPHTIEYLNYLDTQFLKCIKNEDLSFVAELCCGHSELLTLLKRNDICGIGIDISSNMLDLAQKKHGSNSNFAFLQGDATRLPIRDAQFSSVFMFGGIHHIPDRAALFAEVFRILKPGGDFYFREPVSDFFLWRWIRGVIYMISPALEADTERPLLWRETVPLLELHGFKMVSWRTYGFLGFCFFMNSDILVFNRFFRFIPGIRLITRLAAYLDDVTTRIPGLGRAGLQVIGVAKKQ